MGLKVAQTFYIDKSTVREAEHVTITSVTLYFKTKPNATNNRSGIVNPGITLALMGTKDNDIPDVDNVMETGIARLEYGSIVSSSDASGATKFSFPKPCVVPTNKSYAIGLAFDGDEDFVLWTCKEGDKIVGTNTTTSGATARNVGMYFEYASVIDSTNPVNNLGSQWKALSNVDLKMKVGIGVYAANTTVTNITQQYVLPADPVELIIYDRYNADTSNRLNPVVGEMIFQETPVVYGNIKVSANSRNITVASGNVNFSQLITTTIGAQGLAANSNPAVYKKSYIVLRDGGSTASNVNVREVVQILSNTEIVLDRLPTFTNNTASFSVTAAGKLQFHGTHYYDGRWWDGNTWNSYVGRKSDLLRLEESNANATVRFSNNYLQQITINNGGTGYSNSDVITIYPITNTATSNSSNIAYIPSYANAIANVVTNGSGTITGILYKNAGFGLTSNTNMIITTSAGTGANLSYTVGSKLRAETANASFGNTVVVNIPIHRSFPHTDIFTNQNNTYRMYQHFSYYTLPGFTHILNRANPAYVLEVSAFTNKDTTDLSNTDGRVYVLASQSNEALMANSVIKLSNNYTLNSAVKSSSMLEVSVTSNNAFSLPLVSTDDVYTYKYVINSNTDGETKGRGSALARHLTNKVTFREGRYAEDILVYMTAYRPAGTDITVYARLHNQADSDAFEDKDWTLLTLQSNNSDMYSSTTNDRDLITYSYGLAGVSVQTVNTISGSVTTSNNSANVVGIGTNFTADLAVNDVVKIYSNLFPDNYIVTVVTAVTNTSQITVADTVVGSSYVGSGFKISLIGRPANGANAEIGFPFQAFSDKKNDNVVGYYNSSMARFNTYNTFQIKTVLTSNNASIVPQIENMSAAGVSA